MTDNLMPLDQRGRAGWAAYWAGTALLTAAAVIVTAYWTPEEATMGVIQKVFYLHMPVAINALLACIVCFVASVIYLSGRSSSADDLAAGAARVAVQLCAVVLLTGMIWGKKAWGVWWDWKSTRLVFSLALFLLYVVYLMVRGSIESSQRRALVSAVYGIVAFLDVPLVYLSTRLIPDTTHPASVPMETAMKWTLALWFVPVTMWTAGAVYASYRLNERRRARQEAWLRESDARGFDVIPVREGPGAQRI